MTGGWAGVDAADVGRNDSTGKAVEGAAVADDEATVSWLSGALQAQPVIIKRATAADAEYALRRSLAELIMRESMSDQFGQKGLRVAAAKDKSTPCCRNQHQASTEGEDASVVGAFVGYTSVGSSDGLLNDL